MIRSRASFDFHGGLILQPERFKHRGSLIAEPVVTMPIPETLFFPLHIRKEEPVAEVCVAVGEKVHAGQALTYGDYPFLPPVIASSAGTISAISNESMSLGNSPTVPHIALETDLAAAKQTRSIDQSLTFQQRLHAAGIRGLGGASFPSSVKLMQNASVKQPIETLIINAAECEPLIQCDEALMIEQADEIIQAVHYLRQETHCQRCLIGIEADKPKAIARLSAAIENQPDDATKLVVIPAKFPTGGERQLIKVLTNQEIPHRSHPASLGFVCFNVATALAIKQALVDQIPFSTRIVSVTGSAIKTPRNVRVTIGTPIRRLIEFVDSELKGLTLKDPEREDHGGKKTLKITVGGPVSGRLVPEDNYPVTTACNCLLVEPVDAKPDPATACIRCGDCDSVCPQLLLPQQLYWYTQAGNFAEVERFKIDACIECGCCDLVCPSHIPLTTVFHNTKSTIHSQRLATEFAERSKERFEKRESRLQQKELQRQQRIQQRKAEIDAKKTADPKAAVKAALARAQRRKPGNSSKPDSDSSAT